MRAAVLVVALAACGKGAEPAATSAASGSAAAPSADVKTGTEAAGRAIQKLAYQAYPVWAASHRDRECPTSLDDLKALAHDVDLTDPWGHPYELLCGDTLPKGVHNIGVRSRGPDGQPDTADDVVSWK